jgi:hypothetical protein
MSSAMKAIRFADGSDSMVMYRKVHAVRWGRSRT